MPSKKRTTNTRRLLELMEANDLSRADVARMLNRSVKTVSCWRCESPRAIPEREIDRLELKLQIAQLQRTIAKQSRSAAGKGGAHA